MGKEDEQRTAFEATVDTFMQLLTELLRRHEGKWVIIKYGEKEPLGFSKSQELAYKRGVRTYGSEPFFVGQVIREASPITITRELGI